MMLWNRKVKIIEETQLLKFVLIVNPNNSGFVSSIEIDAIIHTVFTSQFKNPYKQKTQTSRSTWCMSLEGAQTIYRYENVYHCIISLH